MIMFIIDTGPTLGLFVQNYLQV